GGSRPCRWWPGRPSCVPGRTRPARPGSAASAVVGWSPFVRVSSHAGIKPAPLSILSSKGQVSRQEALGFVEALLRRILGIAGVGAHGKAVPGAVVKHEGADLAEGPHPRLH